MKKPGKRELRQAAVFLLCILMPLLSNKETSELSGGRITGPLVSLFDDGLLLFIAAFLLTFFYSRVAAAVGVVACLICFPLYFYYMAPGIFRFVFKGNYSVPLHGIFVWDATSMIGVLIMATAAFVCSHRLWAGRGKTGLASSV